MATSAGRRRLSAVFLLLLAAACATPEPAPPTARLDTLRLVDINVWSGLDYTGTLRMGEYETPERRERRYRALVCQLRALAPDVVAVHEANPLPAYIDRLARDLGYDAVQHVGLGGVRAGPVGLPWNLREGDAILARPELGLRSEGRRQLSGGPVGSFFSFHFADATQVLAASIGVNDARIFLFATHWHASPPDLPRTRALLDSLAGALGAGPDTLQAALEKIEAGAAWRMEEAERTLGFIREVAGEAPVVLMGDFNATTATAEVRRLLDAGFVDAHGAARADPRPTWDPGRNLNIREHYLRVGAGEGPSAGEDPGEDRASAEAGPPPTADDLLAALDRATRTDRKRIDLVLVRPGEVGGATEPAAPREPGEPAPPGERATLRVLDARVVLDEVVDGVHASDHFGVLAELWVGEAGEDGGPGAPVPPRP